jgi:hypothetical protein
MPNYSMVEAIESILDRNVDLLADTIKVMLVKSGYAPNLDNQFIDEGGANDPVDHRVTGTTDQTLAGKVIGKDTTGDFAYFDANDATFALVPSGETAAGVVIYKSTGVDTTSKILGFADITDTPTNGGDIVIQWATPANGGVWKHEAIAA